MMLLRWIGAWFNRPSTATRIRALEEQTRQSERRAEELRRVNVTGNPIEGWFRPPPTKSRGDRRA